MPALGRQLDLWADDGHGGISVFYVVDVSAAHRNRAMARQTSLHKWDIESYYTCQYWS